MNTTCNVCDKPYSAPLQCLVAGVILEQCVALCHDRHVFATSPSNSYEFLKAAKARFRSTGATRAKG